MKKRGITGLVTFTLLALFLLPGCVSMDQINTLEQEISSLQSDLSTITTQNIELESELAVNVSRNELESILAIYATSEQLSTEISNYVTKQKLITDLNNFVTKQDLTAAQKVRDNLLNGLSDELQSARGEIESIVGALAKGSDLQLLAERVSTLEEDFGQVNYVIAELMSYGGYSSSAEMMEFAFGLVDMYDSLSDVQSKLQKLKEAMSLFVLD